MLSGSESLLPFEETRHPYTGSATRWGCAAKAGRAGMLTRDRNGRVHLVETVIPQIPRNSEKGNNVCSPLRRGVDSSVLIPPTANCC